MGMSEHKEKGHPITIKRRLRRNSLKQGEAGEGQRGEHLAELVHLWCEDDQSLLYCHPQAV